MPDEFGKEEPLRYAYMILTPLVVVAIFGNLLVFVAVLLEEKLHKLATNKFIASLAFSDLMVGALVMPFALYMKINNNRWELGRRWCHFHLCSSVFSTTASIIHLVAISVDRYFAIIFPTEYQRHSVRTKAGPYIVMMWILSLAISVTTLMEPARTAEFELNSVDHRSYQMCWLEDSQYLILSTLMSFLIPASIVCFLYLKIFRKLQHHLLATFKRKFNINNNPMAMTLPEVVVEEVKSRRGSHISRDRSGSNESRGSKSSRSASQPDILAFSPNLPFPRFRSPTICGDTIGRTAQGCSRRRNSSAAQEPDIVDSPPPPPEPSSRRNSDTMHLLRVPNSNCNNLSPITPITEELSLSESLVEIHNSFNHSNNNNNSLLPPTRAPTVPLNQNNTLKINYLTIPEPSVTLTVPCIKQRADSVDNRSCGSGTTASGSSVTSASSDDHRSSIFSFGSSLTDDTIEMCSRRASALSGISVSPPGSGDSPTSPSLRGRRISSLTGGKLRQIASQVTRAIRRKRRESIAIRRESKATRVVAAILIVFILCWLPYFVMCVYRGICLAVSSCRNSSNIPAQIQVYLVTSWLGYAHSCFNPVIYTCLNKNFRATFKRILHLRCGKHAAFWSEWRETRTTE